MVGMRASARLLMLIGLLVSGVLKADEPARQEPSVSLPVHCPLVPPSDRWDLGPCRKPGKIGDRDFYFAESGFWWRTDRELLGQIDQVGLSRRMIPGSIRLDVFDPHKRNGVSPVPAIAGPVVSEQSLAGVDRRVLRVSRGGRPRTLRPLRR